MAGVSGATDTHCRGLRARMPTPPVGTCASGSVTERWDQKPAWLRTPWMALCLACGQACSDTRKLSASPSWIIGK
eukprot:6350735-Alexandrium_andersonii.AAC.1